MNREDIIRMAQEAGFFIQQNEIYSMSTQSDQELTEWIERFAALVASAEREACAKIAETPVGEYEVVVACGTEPAPYLIPRYLNWQDIATTIRARGQT